MARSKLDELREAAGGCTRCDLYKTGTQVVFGEGPRDAAAMAYGEQPVDQEDKQGHPFVGPAGKVLDDGLEAAGIDRERGYLTNVVKHFKWTARGKRRLPPKPNWKEVAACKPWLDGELELVQPNVLVCLGAVAAQALLGKQFRVTRERGHLLESALPEHVLATVHPSSILRGEPSDRERAFQAFVDDLRVVAGLL